MRVLILTPIMPISSAEIYGELTNIYSKTNVDILCYPYFAEVKCMMHNQDYVPTFFAMIKQSLEPVLNKKLYNKQNMIVIGNVYKEELFDIIISYDKSEEDEPFDTYIEMLKIEPELQEFTNKIDIDNLYTLEDATVNLPTIEHIKLFLEGVFK